MYDDSATIQLINILLKDHHYFIQDESLLMKVFYKKIDSLEEIYDEVGKIGLENKIQNPLVEDDEFFQDLYNVVGDPQFLERLLEENPSFDDFYDSLTETLSIDYFDEDLFIELKVFLEQFSIFTDCKKVNKNLYYITLSPDCLLMRVNIGEEDKLKVNYIYSDAVCSRLISFLDKNTIYYTYTDKEGLLEYQYVSQYAGNDSFNYYYEVNELCGDKSFKLEFKSNYYFMDDAQFISYVKVSSKCSDYFIEETVSFEKNKLTGDDFYNDHEKKENLNFECYNDDYQNLTHDDAFDLLYHDFNENLGPNLGISQVVNSFVFSDDNSYVKAKNIS